MDRKEASDAVTAVLLAVKAACPAQNEGYCICLGNLIGMKNSKFGKHVSANQGFEPIAFTTLLNLQMTTVLRRNENKLTRSRTATSATKGVNLKTDC